MTSLLHGIVPLMEEILMSWKKEADCVSRSMTDLICEPVRIHGEYKSSIVPKSPISLYCHNQSTICIVQILCFIRGQSIWSRLSYGRGKVWYWYYWAKACSSTNQLADWLTDLGSSSFVTSWHVLYTCSSLREVLCNKLL